MPNEADLTDAATPPEPGPRPASEMVTLPPAPADAETLPPPSSSSAPAAAPDVNVPGYAILGELGRGGMGVVYRATHLQLRRTVALKMILAGGHAGSDGVQRFLAEAEAVAALQHPNVVQVFDVGSHAQLPYMALEFVGGGSLADRLTAGPLPPRHAARLLAQIAAGVEAAHRKGVVHRDLKPANVLLTDEGVPKVTDFGLAKRVEGGGLTQTGAIMGTPAYMAPEQARGEAKRVGAPADVYALGAILYECLTGRPPFGGSTPLDTVLQVIDQDPVPPSKRRPGLPRDLEIICLKCLEKDPARRYASAAALADDLRRWLADEPIAARAVGRWGRAGRRLKRHRAVIGLVAAAVFLTAGVVGGFVWLTPRPTPAPPPDPEKTNYGFRAGMTQAQVLERLEKIDSGTRLAFLQDLPPELLRFGRVTRGEVRADVIERGVVESADAVEIVSPLPEQQKHLAVALPVTFIVASGAAVKAGDRLAVLDDAPLRAKLRDQQAALDQAQAALTRAAAEKDRLRQVHDSTLKLARLAAEEAEAAVKDFTGADVGRKQALGRTADQSRERQKLAQLQADKENGEADAEWQRRRGPRDEEQARVREVEAAIAGCTLVAPRPGRVEYWDASSLPPLPFGTAVPARYVSFDGKTVGPGQTLLRVYDGLRYQVRVLVQEADVSRVRAGQPANVRIDALPQLVLAEKVRHVSDTGAPGWRSDLKVYLTTVTLDGEHPELSPGMGAGVTVLGESRPNVLRVGRESLFGPADQHGREGICFLRVNGQVRERAVAVGFTGNPLVEITGGVQEGDLVLGSVPQMVDAVRRWLNGEAFPAGRVAEQGGPPVGR